MNRSRSNGPGRTPDSRRKRGEPARRFDGRVVGRFETNEPGGTTLVKRNVDPERHKLRSPEGYATDAAHLAKLREHQTSSGRQSSVLILTVGGEGWEASLDIYCQHGVPFERGFGDQVVLPDRFWRQVAGPRAVEPQLKLFSFAGEEAAP